MIVTGVILLLLGYFLGISILYTIGGILLVIGLVLRYGSGAEILTGGNILRPNLDDYFWCSREDCLGCRLDRLAADVFEHIATARRHLEICRRAAEGGREYLLDEDLLLTETLGAEALWGGSVSAGMAVYDTMRYVKNDVATLALGFAATQEHLLVEKARIDNITCVEDVIGRFQERPRAEGNRARHPPGVCVGYDRDLHGRRS